MIDRVKSCGPPLRPTEAFATIKSFALRPVMSSVKLKTRSNGPLTEAGGVETDAVGAAVSTVIENVSAASLRFPASS